MSYYKRRFLQQFNVYICISGLWYFFFVFTWTLPPANLHYESKRDLYTFAYNFGRY